MKHTPEQLHDKTNAELDEICALAQGWKKNYQSIDSEEAFMCLWRKGLKTIKLSEYTPTTNKEQAVDLMVTYEMVIVRYNERHAVGSSNENMVPFTYGIDFLRAVTIAGILSAQGE